MLNFTTHNILQTNKVNTNVPKIFQTKKINPYTSSKKSKIYNNKSITGVNYVFKAKHFPPYMTEWVNSVYNYNKNITKWLPSLEINTIDLIKNYFNLFLVNYNIKSIAKDRHIRNIRNNTKRLIASKPILKHTNDKVNITVYTYDRNSIYYMNKIRNAVNLERMSEKLGYSAFFKHLRKSFLLLKNNIEKSADTLLENKPLINNNIKMFNETYFSTYIKKIMLADITSIRYKQCISFEQSKYEKQHIQLLTNLLEKIYGKKVVLDIINLKYFYNSSNIFSDTLLTKLRVKKNKIIKVLSFSLDMFNIPPIDKIKVYNEIYNRQKFKQNASLKNLVTDNNSSAYGTNLDNIMDKSLSKYGNRHNLVSSINEKKQSKPNITKINLTGIMESLKYKFTKGIKIEVAGRLTKRNTAQRSVYKHDYKGNIKDVDSSVKRLSTVLLRGHAKPNLVYTQSKSKLRAGAFGLKTWISSD